MSAAQEIIDTASNYLSQHFSEFDLIVPVPPSGARTLQPVITIAKEAVAELMVTRYWETRTL